MAQYCGFRDVVRTTPEHHDAIIAYTSQLMHVVAVAVCDDPDLFDCRGVRRGDPFGTAPGWPPWTYPCGPSCSP